MKIDYKSLGNRIRTARTKANMTQEQLAERLDISPTHLSNIENGTTRVSLTTLVNMANALSVSCDDLICDSVLYARPQFEGEVTELVKGCDEYEIRIVRDVVKSLLATLRRDAALRKKKNEPDQ